MHPNAKQLQRRVSQFSRIENFAETTRSGPPLTRYAAGIAVTLAVLLLRFFATYYWGSSLPLITLYPAILLAAWVGGMGPGLFSCIACAWIGEHFEILPIYSFSSHRYGDFAALMLFMVIGALMVAVLDTLEKTKQSLKDRSQRLSEETAERRNSEERLRAVQQIVDAIIPYSTLEDLLRSLLIHVRTVLKSRTATVLLLEEDGVHLRRIASDGQGSETLEEALVPVGTGIAGVIATSEFGIILNNAQNHDGPEHPHGLTVAGTPLRVDARLVGVLHVTTTGHDTANDLLILRLVAERAALAIERSRVIEIEQKARAAAEAANRMKDNFLAMVSHDLRAPLQAILGAVQILNRLPLPPASQHYLLLIQRNAQIQVRLLQDLIDMSRISGGRLELNRTAGSLRSIVAFTLESMQPKFDQRRLNVESTNAGPERTLFIDVDRVQQIVSNLISNAAKFTEPGGQIKVHVDERSDSEIVLTISDSGVGIDPCFLPNVFAPFRQGDTGARREGLGLGLAIVKNLVELHGGAVYAESAGVGKGSTFRVLLPIAGTRVNEIVGFAANGG